MQTVIDRDCVCTDVRNQLAMIKTMAGNVAQLARQLLLIAAADGEIVTLVDVRDTILQLVPLIERILGNNNRLQTSIEDRLWPVQGSAETIGDILLPLVTNASEAMPGGGTLFIRARNVTKTQRQAQLGNAAFGTHFLLVEVTDDGIGIPEEIMCRVFEPFTTTKGPDPEVQERVAKRLAAYGLDATAIEAKVMQSCHSQVAELDRSLASAESRRMKAIRALAELRGALRHRITNGNRTSATDAEGSQA
jgi:hypothetical protein